MLNFTVITFNHKITPFEILEKVNVKNKEIYQFYQDIDFIEKVYIQTCNRRELYFISKNTNEENYLKNLFQRKFKINEHEFYLYSRILINTQAIEHLINVICGLESVILGENQIVNQVKNSYFFANVNNFCGKFMNIIFQRIFNINKFIRQNTSITKGSLTLGGICRFITNSFFENKIDDKVILYIGTGDIIFSVYKYFKKLTKKTLIAVNKNINKAKYIAEETKGLIINISEIYKIFNCVDIIISATSAPHFILKKEKINNFNNKKLLIMDLAVPRDIDPDIVLLGECIKLINIDDIKKIIKEHIKIKETEINRIKEIVKSKAGEVENEIKNRCESKQFVINPGKRDIISFEKEKVAI
jgi:glutamyl-tRNA reductase